MDRYKIKLTKEQLNELEPLKKKAADAKRSGHPGAILAQVFPETGYRYMTVRFLDERAVVECYAKHVDYKNALQDEAAGKGV